MCTTSNTSMISIYKKYFILNVIFFLMYNGKSTAENNFKFITKSEANITKPIIETDMNAQICFV